jgi:hypothetical protein
MPRATAVALVLAFVALTAAMALLFSPVHISFAGQRVDCGDSVWRFFPVDPGSPEDLPRFDACDGATIPRAGSAMGLGAGAAGLVTLGLWGWHRTAVRRSEVR